jgi:hypothetical protein
MRKTDQWIRIAYVVLLLAATLGTGLAQFGTGVISGVVTDSSDAAIPATQVKVTNERTGQSKITETDGQGRYTVLDLLAGRYSLEISREGFKTYSRTGVELVTGGQVGLNIVLEIGGVTESVQVAASGAQIETLTAQVGKVVESRMFQDIPLNGRNLTSIMLLKPGVSSNSAPNAFRPTSDARSYTILGSRADDAYLSTDGVAMTGGRNNLRGPSTISVDAIEEANILTSSYAAEYPRAGGGQVQFITKSGTRVYHGALFEYLRNDALDARLFQRATKQKLRYNQFGFALGGPVTIPKLFNTDRNRLFFFANTEFISNRGERLETGTVPTASERAGDFNGSTLYRCPRDASSGNPFPNCVIPASAMSRNGQGLLRIYPLPNVVGEPAFNYRLISPSIQDVRTSTFRVDYMAGKHRIFWRGSHSGDHGYGDRPANWPQSPTDTQTDNRSTGLTVTSTLSPNKLNSFRFGASMQSLTNRLLVSGNIADYARTKYGIDFPYLFGRDKEAPDKIPTIIVTGLTQIDGGIWPSRFATPTYQYQDDFTWIRGAHTFKFGGYFEYVGQNNLDQINISTAPGSGNNQNGTFRFQASPGNRFSTGNAVADVITGRFDTYSEIGPKDYTLERLWSSEGYAQDSWKITSHLSLELGLRFAHWAPYYSLWNNMAMFYPKYYDPAQAVKVDPSSGQIIAGSGFRYNGIVLPGTGFPDAAKGRVRFADNPDAQKLFHGLPRSISTANSNVWQPRFGLSWDPFGKGKTSIRLGGGVFYSRFYFNDATVLGGNPPLQDQVVVNTGLVDNPGGTSVAPLFPLPLTMHDPNIKHNRTYNYSFVVQHQLPASFILEVGYIGKLSRHLLSQVNLNQLAPGTLQANRGVNAEALRPYLGYSSILYAGHRGSSEYNGLTVSAERRFYRGLTFQLAYTFSRGIDYGSDKRDLAMITTNLRADKGISSFDRTHVLALSYVYEVPFFRSGPLAVARPVFGGWQFAGFTMFQSGLPTSILISGDVAGVSGGGSQRANVVGNGTLSRGERTLKAFINTSAFAVPAQGAFGNSGRNNIRRPGTNNWDVSISKYVPIHERLKLQLRGELFNIWNHLSYNNFQNTLGNSGFGAINGADPARVIQVALRATF